MLACPTHVEGKALSFLNPLRIAAQVPLMHEQEYAATIVNFHQ